MPSALLPAAPCTISMQARRETGAAAVFAIEVAAGTIESSSGRASDAPIPLRTVRRETCFLVMNITVCLLADAAPAPRSIQWGVLQRGASGTKRCGRWLGPAA